MKPGENLLIGRTERLRHRAFVAGLDPGGLSLQVGRIRGFVRRPVRRLVVTRRSVDPERPCSAQTGVYEDIASGDSKREEPQETPWRVYSGGVSSTLYTTSRTTSSSSVSVARIRPSGRKPIGYGASADSVPT